MQQPVPESLKTWWVELGLAHTLVVDLDQTLQPRTWATLAGTADKQRPASIDLDDLPQVPTRGLEGATLVDVELGEVIGSGAMGVVHKALQYSLNRQVAVKRLKPVTHTAAVAALINEARLTGQLEHPNIPPVHALCREGDRPVLVMKRIVGEVWLDLIHNPEHPAWARTRWADDPILDRHVGIAETLCDALQYAHSHGVVHRDIKPANVMIGAFGEVYLLDWGMAVRYAEIEPTLAPVVGTPAYMAPEMVEGQADPRTDVYLLGAVLHHAITGSPRHLGVELYECLAAIHAATPPVYADDVPAELADIVRKALANKREDRYRTPSELQRALRGFRAHRAANALTSESLTRLGEAANAAPELAGRLLSEAHFGLLQALREWESPRAREGLRECALRLAEWEVDHGDLEAADRYLGELDPVPDGLQERVNALKQVRERGRELQKLALQLDPDVEVAARTRYVVVIAVLMVGLAMVVSWAASVGGSAGYRLAIACAGNAALFTATWMVLRRKQLLANDYNRRISLLVILASGGIFLSRILMMLLQVPMAHALVADLMLLSVVAGAAGITIRPWTFALSALCAAAATAAALFPAAIPGIVAGTAIAAFLIAVGVGLRRGSAAS